LLLWHHVREQDGELFTDSGHLRGGVGEPRNLGC
jgi:hypothetical protein